MFWSALKQICLIVCKKDRLVRLILWPRRLTNQKVGILLSFRLCNWNKWELNAWLTSLILISREHKTNNLFFAYEYMYLQKEQQIEKFSKFSLKVNKSSHLMISCFDQKDFYNYWYSIVNITGQEKCVHKIWIGYLQCIAYWSFQSYI